MNRYQELRSKQQNIFNDLPLGWAFGQKQFDEMMRNWGLDPETDTDKIYSIGAVATSRRRMPAFSTRPWTIWMQK